jgi:hypothetical protein
MFVSNWDEPIKNKLVYKEEQDRKENNKKKRVIQNLKNYRMRCTRKTGNHHHTTGRIIFKTIQCVLFLASMCVYTSAKK